MSLSCAAKSRAIAIPVDLDSQVNNLFLKSHNIVQKTAMNWRLSARNAARRDSVLAASRDYRNIIERLQVMPVPSLGASLARTGSPTQLGVLRPPTQLLGLGWWVPCPVSQHGHLARAGWVLLQKLLLDEQVPVGRWRSLLW